MKPAITLLVRSRTGAAHALVEVARRRATDLGLRLEIIPLLSPDLLPPGELPGDATADESLTALVPVDFASAHHEAWCFLCQLSLLRCEIGFSILVLGAASHTAFRARQRALLGSRRAPRSAPARTTRAA